MKNYIVTLLSVLSFSSYATNYYVSLNGDDANPGTSESLAWRTIGKVNQSSFSFGPGDNILFERGGTYRGRIIVQQSGSAGTPISFGAYGSGPKPIISGSLPISGWTMYSGNIWQASFLGPIDHLYSNGTLQTLARFPNNGWLRNDIGAGTYLYDAALTQQDGYWNGAEVVIRSTMWSYDVAEITNFSGSSLNFQDIYYDLQDYEWGYFMQNKLEELDQAGEWFYDENSQTLYFWAPNNDDPNNLTMEAGTETLGIEVQWNRHDINIENLHFKHQCNAAARIDGASNIEISNCRFSDLYMAFSTYGSNNTYTENIVERSYASAANMIDDNSVVSNNEFNDIALIPGLGESNWGYMGIRILGTGNSIINNRLVNIGYLGIVGSSDALIQNNYVQNAVAILNDGGGIGAQGDGMTIIDNIVIGLHGDLESAAPDFDNYHQMCHGIYFGNYSNQNITIEGNTVANCSGAGIHVDHTMVSNNIQIINNVLYNNNIQIQFSDLSNFSGPGAVAPYYVDSYNTIVTGNVFYSLTAEQKCMNQFMVHTAAHTDYGTFDDNYYFNPYNEQIILITDNHAGNIKYRYTLERWQNEMNKDLNSSASQLHLTKYQVTNVNSSNLTSNGTFNYDVSDWSAWPNEGQLTHDQSFLDNGSLKVHFDDNTTYDYLNTQNVPTVSVQDGEYYRVKFSLLSNQHGELRVAFKANSQQWNITPVHDQYLPFDNSRREIEYIFKSDISDNGRNHFLNDWDESTYWIDNVEMHKVSVIELDPTEKSILLYNDGLNSQTLPLSGCFSDVNGILYSNEITLAPFSSAILVSEDIALCGMTTGIETVDLRDEIIVYPSPTNGTDRIKIKGINGTSHIEIYDLNGVLVLRDLINSQHASIDLPNLPPAMYLVQVRTENSIFSTKLVVQ